MYSTLVVYKITKYLHVSILHVNIPGIYPKGLYQSMLLLWSGKQWLLVVFTYTLEPLYNKLLAVL